MDYPILQSCFYMLTQFSGLATLQYLALFNTLVKFSANYVLKEGMFFLHIGTLTNLSFAFAAHP